ncbi:MAG: hypothetical protein GX220_00595 [Treponema sp.]|jgi:hypothetical protein|nr:hypothetical protein [Treponema sp.]
MKKIFLCSTLIFLTIFAHTQEVSDTDELHPVTGFPIIKEAPFIVFNEGITISNVTRIQKQNDRSNFVFDDFMIGAYLSFTTFNMKPIDSTVRIAIFYPLNSAFNSVLQEPKQVLRYAFDLFAGPIFKTDMWNYVRINFAPGLHFLYQMSDRFNYFNLGAGIQLGLELPLSKHWTILINGFASLDNGNFGSNNNIEPYDITYEFQLDLGFRYSKKAINKFSYIF